jgi:excisionase family DNA binding protein
MSAERVESAAYQQVVQSDKPLEFQGRGEPVAVHSVSSNPSVIDRFGAYLVPSPEPAVRLLSVKDLAARWAVCTATIYSLAKSGRLESLRIGNSIRFMARAVTVYEQTRIRAKAERHLGPNRKR